MLHSRIINAATDPFFAAVSKDKIDPPLLLLLLILQLVLSEHENYDKSIGLWPMLLVKQADERKSLVVIVLIAVVVSLLLLLLLPLQSTSSIADADAD